MDRLQALKVFMAVAQRQSFAEAARSLHISPTAASRAVSELEQSLGAILLRRTTRSVGLTPEGQAYLERCRGALDELDAAERDLRGQDAEPRGKLTLTAPQMFGRLHILPLAQELLARHPKLEIEMMFSPRLMRLAEDGIDIAVRLADLTDSALHAVKIAEVHRVLVASPAYLAQRGTPRDLDALSDHDQIAYDNFAPMGEWRFQGQAGVKLTPRLVLNDIETALAAALADGGVTRTWCYQADAHVQAGRLVYLLKDLAPPAVGVYLVFQANRQASPNVRAFIAAAKARFATQPYDCALHHA